MNRRDFLKTSFATAAVGSLVASGGFAADKNSTDTVKPNIVFILVDDLGWDEAGCYGARTGMKTPNIDKLASEGVRFRYATAASMCSPARAQVISGRYGYRTGINSNVGDPGGTKRQLDAAEILVPQAFQRLGYRTGLFGKLHLHWNNAAIPTLPEQMGFDEYFYYAGLPYDAKIKNNERRLAQSAAGMVYDQYNVPWTENGKPYKDDRYSTEVLTDKVIDFIKSNRKKPFIAWVPHFAIHEPFQAPEKYKQMYPIDEKMEATFAECIRRARIRGVWLDRQGLINYKPPIEMFQNRLAQATALDDNIGRVLKTLDETGLSDNTIVVLTSDNGPHPLAGGGKADIIDMSVRVPLIVRWGKNVPAGKVSDALIDNVDIYPTLIEAAGANMPQGLKFDGVSFFGSLKNPQDKGKRDHGFTCLKGQMGLYDHNWFYSFSPNDSGQEKMYSRLTPPYSIQQPVPLDLVPQGTLERFRTLAETYISDWHENMSRHRKDIAAMREKSDEYGDRHEEIFGIRR